MEPWGFVLVLLLIGVGLAVQYYLKQKRREEWRHLAKQLGFAYSQDDPFGLLGLPFALFSKGDGRGVENVSWGTHNDMECRIFDYWYYEESRDSEGKTSRSYSRFTCAYTLLRAPLRGISIAPEGLWSRFKDAVGLDDIDFESEEFNRSFEVRALDRRFASYLVDARMMQWLLYAKGGWRYEISDQYLLCYSGRIKPVQAFQLLGALRGFRDHIPDVVWDVYGSG